MIADNAAGLLFKNKRDRKVINVDPQSRPGDNSIRTEIPTNEYLQVVIYDHMTRRKSWKDDDLYIYIIMYGRKCVYVGNSVKE